MVEAAHSTLANCTGLAEFELHSVSSRLRNLFRTKSNLPPLTPTAFSDGFCILEPHSVSPQPGHCRCLSPLVAPVPAVYSCVTQKADLARRRYSTNSRFWPPRLSHNMSISSPDLPRLFLFWKVSPKNVRPPALGGPTAHADPICIDVPESYIIPQ